MKKALALVLTLALALALLAGCGSTPGVIRCGVRLFRDIRQRGRTGRIAWHRALWHPVQGAARRQLRQAS